MLASLAPLAEIYKTNTKFLFESLKDISDSDIIVRPNDKGNSLHWIAGHLATSRYVIVNMAGLNEKCPWGELFDYGASIKELSAYPQIIEIMEVWTSISNKLIIRLDELTETEIQEKAPYDFPTDDKTILGGIAFLSLHDSYHIGQLAYIRRLLGYSSLAG